MSDKKIVSLSLFSGIGGFEVGMARAGFTFAKTLEWDEKCCETLNQNKEILCTEEDEIFPIDITKLPPSEFYDGKVDYIVGGPPCQSFSAAGRRAGGVAGTTDARGTLFEYYCKYVDYFKPKAFVFENVRGILSANKGQDFKLIMESFENVGYKLFWKILNAADYGAPQLRERVFLVGIKKDLNIDFKFPLPTYGPDSEDKRPYVTTGEAIADVQDENEVVPPYTGKYGHLLPDIPPGENYRFYTEEMGHPNPQFAWRSKFSNFLYKMDPNDVCRTVIAYQGKYDGPFHWKNRKCTVEELQRLQGFPHEFVINQKYSEGVKQVGNSVWYKDGGIMTKPTAFGMNGSSLMVGGESGAEAILPLSAFYKQLEAMIDSKLDMSGMEKYLAVIADNSSKGIYLEDGTLVGHLLPAIDNGLGKQQKITRRLAL